MHAYFTSIYEYVYICSSYNVYKLNNNNYTMGNNLLDHVRNHFYRTFAIQNIPIITISFVRVLRCDFYHDV